MLAIKIKEQQKEQLIKIAVGLSIFAICYSVIIQPVFQDVTFLRQKVLDSKKRLDLYQEIRDFKENLSNFENSLTTTKNRSMLLGKMSDLANQSGLKVQTLTPKTAPEGEYIKLSIELEGKGSFFSLLKFFKAMESEGAALIVRSISLLRQGSLRTEEEKYPLQIQIELVTFLKQGTKKNNV